MLYFFYSPNFFYHSYQPKVCPLAEFFLRCQYNNFPEHTVILHGLLLVLAPALHTLSCYRSYGKSCVSKMVSHLIALDVYASNICVRPRARARWQDRCPIHTYGFCPWQYCTMQLSVRARTIDNVPFTDNVTKMFHGKVIPCSGMVNLKIVVAGRC